MAGRGLRRRGVGQRAGLAGLRQHPVGDDAEQGPEADDLLLPPHVQRHRLGQHRDAGPAAGRRRGRLHRRHGGGPDQHAGGAGRLRHPGLHGDHRGGGEERRDPHPGPRPGCLPAPTPSPSRSTSSATPPGTSAWTHGSPSAEPPPSGSGAHRDRPRGRSLCRVRAAAVPGPTRRGRCSRAHDRTEHASGWPRLPRPTVPAQWSGGRRTARRPDGLPSEASRSQPKRSGGRRRRSSGGWSCRRRPRPPHRSRSWPPGGPG